MKYLIALCLALFSLSTSAQNDKLLLELGATGEKLNASRYSIADKYSANYTVADLGHGFVLGFDRTYAFFNNDMELQWKATLPIYDKHSFNPLVLGDKKKTYIIDFSPSFRVKKSMQIKEINNADGTIESYELFWESNGTYKADYNLHNGVISILIISEVFPSATYLLITVENKKLTESTFELPINKSEANVDANYKALYLLVFKGDRISSELLNLSKCYAYRDKKNRANIAVYEEIELSPKGGIVGNGFVRALDFTENQNHLYYSLRPIEILELDGKKYFVALVQKNGIPQGWLYGFLTADGKFTVIKEVDDVYKKIIAPIVKPSFSYLPNSKTFVLQHHYFVGMNKARLRRSFFDEEGNVILIDELVFDPGAVLASGGKNSAMSTYSKREVLQGNEALPENLSYFNLIDEYSKKKTAQPVHFHALERGNGFIVVIVDPNTGKVTGTKML